MSDLQLILTTIQREVLDSFASNFECLPNWRIHQGYYQELQKHDAVVSPANSFGLMDGGFDLLLTQRFGEQLMKRVMRHIDEHYLGEQPVGTAFVIETGHPHTPWLVHAPTMRVPVLVAGTDVAYRSTWAALIAIHNHNKQANGDKQIKSVVVSGMGAGCGRMSPESVGQQMALAWARYQEVTNRTASISETLNDRWQRAISIQQRVIGAIQ